MKETFYFSHDYNTRSDEKIKLLIRKHSMEGYGIYWAIIEDLYNNANALRTDYDGIAYDLRVDIDVVKSVINDFDLFVIDDECFGSLSVERRLAERENKSKKASVSAYSRWRNANALKTDANALLTDEERIAIKERKGKDINESKEKESINIYADSELHFEIMDWFGFTEMKNPDKLSTIYYFLNILNTDKRVEHFKEQFENYKKYKEISKELIHSFPGFMGTIEQRYLDGGWNASEWGKKLIDYSSRGTDVNKSESIAEYNMRVVTNLRKHG